MKKRISFSVVQPDAYTAMEGLDKFVEASTVNKHYIELIKIRASQINGCAYCVDMHSHDALKQGESIQRVLLVSAWREAGNIFSEEERLIFKMTEEITLIHQHGLTEESYTKSIEIFGEQHTAQIIMIIVTINAWTRIGVSLEMAPPLRKKEFMSTN
ncbi:MAG: carboxymuconolactone decarboxylase family protein [Ferruginibacter sp.]